MRRHFASATRITGTSLAALIAIPGIVTITRAQLGTGKPPAESIPPHGYVISSKPLPGTNTPADYTFVLTRDEVYVPIIVRKPKGSGPFPAITMGWGEGREGMKKVERLAESLSQMQDRMIARGYVVATVNYRNEIPYAYEQSKPPQNLPDSISGERRMLKSGPTLDHEDLIAVIRYLQSLPYVDKNGVGAMGVSHSGEMIMKASSEYTFGAGVCVEPADHEFLTVDTGPNAPRKGTEIQYNDVEVVRKNANKAEAMERIQRINTPILIFGRDTDHLQGIFKLTYEWMREAGKDVQWASFNHPTHGYVFIMNQPDGSYKPDEIQQKTFDIFMDYFDKRLKHAR
ncbi:MAG TPA: prolyl oligopeptidase family serine peptidase [Terriglobales bacterium]|nr:prolyl oligopeptidase family serine peptidase [Terriglobales bacterium]